MGLWPVTLLVGGVWLMVMVITGWFMRSENNALRKNNKWLQDQLNAFVDMNQKNTVSLNVASADIVDLCGKMAVLAKYCDEKRTGYVQQMPRPREIYAGFGDKYLFCEGPDGAG